MTEDHGSVRELLAPVALEAATPAEVALVERHVVGCDQCRNELALLREAAMVLAHDVPQVDPPPRLKRRVMAAVRDERARRLPASPRGSSWSRWLRPRPVLVGALAAVALGLLGWNIALQTGGGARVNTVALRGTQAAPAVRGQLAVLPDAHAAVLRLSNLPRPAAGERYELWTVHDERAVSAGFLTSRGGGRAVATVPDLRGVTALAVTPEPPSNTVAPTGNKVVLVPIENQG